MASIALPPQLFTKVDSKTVGVFFALYSQPTLFPVRQPARKDNDTTTLRNEVASSVVAATVGPGLVFRDINPPVVINLRLTDLTFNKPDVSETLL